ncbi:MAG: hypothetical protein LBP34_04210 [Flavobacteriaceae bacterium]|jgi:hypothetical protein|nr:hypothetical protein [Flavobacteriaceae bacterium]
MKITEENSVGRHTATCLVVGSECIKIIFHGQETELSRKNSHTADSFLNEMLNPAGDVEEILDNKITITI